LPFSIYLLLLCSFCAIELWCETIQTFYGDIEVQEPVLLELMQSPAMQRLKYVHQYGVSYYTTHREEYTRFDHSIGVWAILKMKGATLEEQIAGLLHDVSHTIFSHVGDWVFKMQNLEEDYQTSIHQRCLILSGIETILNQYGYTIEQISPKREIFTMLEQPLPNLAADRIDYNIQGAYFQHFLTKEEAQELFQDLSFEDGKWLITRKDLASKLTRFSLFMTADCWSSVKNNLTSNWLAEAIVQGIHIDLLSWNEFHFGIDQEIWDRLLQSQDPLIQNRMDKIAHAEDFYRCVDPSQANTFISFKSRGIDPWIKQENSIVRLTSLDPELAEAFYQMKETAVRGWPLVLINE
jgi:uncharacterized protein